MVSSIGSSQIEHFGRSIAFHKHPDKRNLIEKKTDVLQMYTIRCCFFFVFLFYNEFLSLNWIVIDSENDIHQKYLLPDNRPRTLPETSHYFAISWLNSKYTPSLTQYKLALGARS